jgi:asparagine synthase (glutamine-hydrolysing)
MSGIYGILHLDGRPVGRSDLERMGEKLSHRGPNGTGLWLGGPVGLGHRMLWTTPESIYERLPLSREINNCTITADARLDNRDELITHLCLDNAESNRIADSELILRCYEKWGEQCTEHLLGDFAFAIWNAREQVLFCARDHFGVKPFYYHFAPSQLFAFATEIKGLFCLSQVPRCLDEVKIAAHLAAVSDDKSRTFYKSVHRLPPGNTISVGRNGLRLRSYWRLDPERELHLKSDEEYAEAFRQLFQGAVQSRIRSNFPIGSMLSGGLDSSSVTCMARDLLAKNGANQLNTFSAVFDKVPECDESSFQQTVLRQNNVVPHLFHADGTSPLTDVEKVLWHQDEACFAGNLYLHWCQYEPARKLGIRVMLDGFDGDTTVSHGLGYLNELAMSGRWLSLAREVKDYSAKLERPWLGAYRAWVWKYGLNPWISKSRLLRQGRRVGRAVKRRFVFSKQDVAVKSPSRVPFNPDFARRNNLPERFRSGIGAPRTERDNHFRLLNRAILPDSLEVLDKAAGAFGLELRYPFFDTRLVEFCLSLPPEQKMSRGWTRLVMRRAMNGILPPEIQWRGGKSDLGPGFDYGLRTFERSRLEMLFFHESDIIENYLDISAIRTAYHRFVAGNATDGEGLLMWRAVSLALWLQREKHVQSTNQRKED